MQPENDNRKNDSVIQTLDYDRKVMAEEVLHGNAHKVQILPTKPEPKYLPLKEFMEPIIHKTCGEIAFYYTHRLEPYEIMTASRARDIDGKTIDPGAPMVCGSCKGSCGPGTLQMRPLHES